MYQVSLFNGEEETIIHSVDSSAPHILNLSLKESLSNPEQLSFSLPINNPGFNKIEGLTTKVKVTSLNDNKVVFSGRIIPYKDGMTSEGKFNKIVTAEGAMAYLIDTSTRRWNFTNKTPAEIIQFLLNQHNSKVDASRKVYLGTIEVTQPITIDTNFETTLNAIVTKVRNILGGDLRVQERSGVLYLDYLRAQGANNNVEVRLGYNLKEIVREYDPTDIISRAIPLGYGEGINQLDITKINGGVEYVDNSVSISKYGVIEGVVTNKDIQNADTLKIYGYTVLEEKKQPKLTYTQSALDLSVLTGHENEKYDLGDTLHTIVDILNIDVYSRVIERERDLINEPWNPRLTISTRPISLSNEIIDLKQRNLTLENAPQGNTCIFPIPKAENADAGHPITIDLDIPKETININKVYINIHGRKFRADSKGTAAGGGIITTTKGGGGTATSTKGGGSYQKESVVQSKSAEVDAWKSLDDPGYNITPPTGIGEQFVIVSTVNGFEVVDIFAFGHKHNFSITIPAINIGEHTHEIELEDHEHEIELEDHEHTPIYGIYESTYPKNTKIKVNGQDIGINLGNGEEEFNQYDIDITSHVSIGNNKIEITTEQNGRIDAIVYSQIFIQSK